MGKGREAFSCFPSLIETNQVTESVSRLPEAKAGGSTSGVPLFLDTLTEFG